MRRGQAPIGGRWYLGVAAAAVGLTAGAAPALAQEAEQAPAAEAAADNGIGDIVVTARRKEESLQSVPIAVQAFSGDMLSKQNVQDATDLQKLVPALTTYQQARDEVTMSIRGQSSSGASSQGQNPRVTAYFSQVPLQTGDTGPGKFFDLQNVQVLKGPQGTLFGRNSTGGAVLYEATRPTNNLGGYVNLQYGRFDDRQVEGALNIPASDTLAFRFAGKLAKRDGFTKNIVTGQELDDRNYLGLRGSALWTPSDSFENYLMVDYTRSSTNGSSAQLGGVNINARLGTTAGGVPIYLGGTSSATRYALFPNLTEQLANQIEGGPRISQSAVDGMSKQRGWGITNISTWKISDNLTLKNIFGYRRYKQASRYDMDGTVNPILDQVTPDGDWSANLRQISNETQLQGKAFDGALDFTVGAFVLWSKSPSPQRNVQVSVGTPSLTITSPVERSQALFGQFTYDFSDAGVEGLSFTAGYRYTHDFRSLDAANYRDKTANAANGWTFSYAPSTCNYANGCPNYSKVSFNASSYNFSLDYKIDRNTLVYLTHRKGYRAGGLNPQAGNFGLAYDPEKITDIELGLKSDFNVGGVDARLNLAAFQSVLKDAQVSQSFATEVNGTTTLANLTVNAAKAKVKGIEADLTLKPFRDFTLGASYSYTDGKYKKMIDVQTGNEIVGRPFPFLAKHRLNISANYVVPLADNVGELAFGANWAYSSKYNLSVFDEPFGTENGYNQLDLRADWNNVAGKEGLSVGVFVNNVTKELYKIGGVPIYSVVGTTSVLYNEPRTWGVQLRYRFGN